MQNKKFTELASQAQEKPYPWLFTQQSLRVNENENKNYQLMQNALKDNPTYLASKEQIKALGQEIAQNEKNYAAISHYLQNATDPDERKSLTTEQYLLMEKQITLRQTYEGVVADIALEKARVANHLGMSRTPRYHAMSDDLKQSIEVYQSVADRVFEYAAENRDYTIGEITTLSLPLFLSDVEQSNIRSFLSFRGYYTDHDSFKH